MSTARNYRLIGLAGLCALAATAGATIFPQDTIPTYVPSETTVAILPVINVSGEPDPNFNAGQVKAASDELHKQFSIRGFKVLDDKLVADAIAQYKIDLADEEQHSRKTVYKIGSAVNATLAVFVVINKVYTKSNQHFFSVGKEGHAKVTAWLVDVKLQKPILSAASKEAKQEEQEVLVNSVKGSEQIAGACASAVRAVLADPLKPYPPAKEKGSFEK